MNTLFRFSESLQYVEDFRRMWRELDKPAAEKIVSEAEATVTAHAHPVCIFQLLLRFWLTPISSKDKIFPVRKRRIPWKSV